MKLREIGPDGLPSHTISTPRISTRGAISDINIYAILRSGALSCEPSTQSFCKLPKSLYLYLVKSSSSMSYIKQSLFIYCTLEIMSLIVVLFFLYYADVFDLLSFQNSGTSSSGKSLM